MFFAFANIIIHSIFNTDPRDWTVNAASSYLDLSPLYGSSQAEVDGVRRRCPRLFEGARFADVGWVDRQGRDGPLVGGRLRG